MNNNQKRVLDFMSRIPSQATAIATSPRVPSIQARLLRARLMMEEPLETIRKGLGVDICLRDSEGRLHEILFENLSFSTGREVDLVEVADGLSDSEVVNLGTAIVCGIDHQPVFDLVMDNNDLKTETGTIDEHGKLVKAADHPKPDVKTLLAKQAALPEVRRVQRGWKEEKAKQ